MEDLVILIIIFGVSIVVIIYLKINEINKEIDNQKLGQQKLGEKLKIHEQLINIKADIKNLQRRCKK